MVKRFVEATIAYEDDPTINPDGYLEASSREKEGETGAWTDPVGRTDYVPQFWLKYPWLQLGIKKI